METPPEMFGEVERGLRCGPATTVEFAHTLGAGNAAREIGVRFLPDDFPFAVVLGRASDGTTPLIDLHRFHCAH